MPMAQKWFNAPKPYAGKGTTELSSAYYQWRLWNAVTWSRYKGGVIVEKATGKSVSWPHGEESEEEEEGSEKETEESEEEEEMTAAKAAVRVE